MRFVIIGSTRLTERVVRAVNQLEPLCKLAGVVTSSANFRISYAPEGVNNVMHADLERLASDLGVESVQMSNSMFDPGLLDIVHSWKPDVLLVAGWFHMIPKTWLVEFDCYGLHASLLPRYSGGAPLVWAMIQGETITGITMFQMTSGVDSGPIVDQLQENIYAVDTISTLYSRIEDKTVELILKCLPRLAKGTVVLREQDETLRSVMPQRKPSDAEIDWKKDSAFLDRWVRAQTRPYPGAFTRYGGELLHIWKSHHIEFERSGIPGTVSKRRDQSPFVACGSGYLRLEEVGNKGEIYCGPDIWSLFQRENIALG